jgi:molybdopterin synthase catalytic subunit
VLISVRLGNGLSQRAGLARLAIELPDGATVAGLIAALRQKHPDLEAGLSRAVAVTVGRQAAVDETLVDGQEVALLLPVSGGSFVL